eukprot:COSAG01_NODE_53520_length_338_cov_2.589958_1_plen_25_part_10
MFINYSFFPGHGIQLRAETDLDLDL